MNLTYKEATAADIPLLVKTAFDSKKYWGYPDEWMEMWRSQFDVTEGFIQENIVIKAFFENQFVGFFVLVDLGKKVWDLDAFWIVASEIGKGFGRLIFAHMMELVKKEDVKKLEVVADPNANGFYEKMGGKWVRKFPSMPEGRELDVYEFDL